MDGLRHRSRVLGQQMTRHSTIKGSNNNNNFEESQYARCFKKISAFVIFILLACFFIYWTSPIIALPVDDLTIVSFEGPFAINTDLSFGKRIPMYAPESIVEDEKQNLYVGLRSGEIVKIYPSSFGSIGEGGVKILTNGTLATAATTNDISHGIPLGLRLRGNMLFVMDAIYGLYTLDLHSNEIKVLIKPTDVKPPMMFPNDLDITANGEMIYFTDTSYMNSITSMGKEFFEGSCFGRLLSYNVLSKVVTTIAHNLCFANGVQLTSDEKMVILSETSRFRVVWINVLTGRKKRVLNLPAMPDNIRKNKQGSYWIGASGKMSSALYYLLQYPFLRQILVRIVPEFMQIKFCNKEHNMLFEVNDIGEIYSTRHDPNGNLTYALSQGTELSDGRIALGSYAADYLAISENEKI